MKKLGYLAILAIPALSFAAGTGHQAMNHRGGVHHAHNVYTKGAMPMHATGPDYYTSIVDAVQHGTVNFNLRLRHETADVTGSGNTTADANATTLRTLLTYQTAHFYGLTGMLQASNNFRLGSKKHYNDGTNAGNSAYDNIMDPSTTDITQAYLNYDFGMMGAFVRYGRQAINYDNQRFVGSDDFRQNMQTFDAASVGITPLPKLNLEFNYVTKVHTIFGDEARTITNVNIGQVKSRDQFYHVAYAGVPYVKLSAYDYNLDYKTQAANSSNTYGILAHDKIKVMQNTSVMYAAEFAKQKDAHNNTADYSANYWSAKLGMGWNGLNVAIAQSVKDGNGTSYFRTPLASPHSFNGWADVFSTGITSGLKDKYLTVSYAPKQFVKNLMLQGEYHKFSAETGGAKYGSEYDLGANYGVTKHLSVGAEYANFKAKTATSMFPTTKRLFLTVEANV